MQAPGVLKDTEAHWIQPGLGDMPDVCDELA